MKNNAVKRIRRKSEIKVGISIQKEGANHERFSMALNLILSEKDVLEYLNKKSGVLSPLPDCRKHFNKKGLKFSSSMLKCKLSI
jgi:hypothetical protein